jgi:hypothetical protein
MLRVHRAVQVIEERSGQKIAWSFKASEDEINHALRVAHVIETGICPYKFRSVELVGNSESRSSMDVPGEGAIVLEQRYVETVFGETLDLGPMRVPLGDCRIETTGEAKPAGPVELRVTPNDGSERSVAAQLLKFDPPPQNPDSTELSEAA